MTFIEPVILGRTGLKVGRLGISSSYGAPAAAYEEAFERGCNYFVMGSFMKGRSKEMIKAIDNIVRKGQRDNLNTKGMDFQKMCPHSKKYGDCGIHHNINIFDIYRFLARIAAVAAHREIIELEARVK